MADEIGAEPIYLSIRHLTRFRYSAPISQSVMEVRMQPLTEGIQHCLKFSLATTPRARVLQYRDYMGNTVHHFDIPSHHSQLAIVAESLVQMGTLASLPDALGAQSWAELDAIVRENDYIDFLSPSEFARPTTLLEGLAAELDVAVRRDDPLTLLRKVNSGIAASFTYCPETTEVDSPIDHALTERRGVCQDFSHIMIAIARRVGIPCRYVSGYLFHRVDADNRSARDATHAWVEALVPGSGWVGFDPTNNRLAGRHHVRVAAGRDYADAPPTRGVFHGEARSVLAVAVEVAVAQGPEPEAQTLTAAGQFILEQEQYQQQQQQQQQ